MNRNCGTDRFGVPSGSGRNCPARSFLQLVFSEHAPDGGAVAPHMNLARSPASWQRCGRPIVALWCYPTCMMPPVELGRSDHSCRRCPSKSLPGRLEVGQRGLATTSRLRQLGQMQPVAEGDECLHLHRYGVPQVLFQHLENLLARGIGADLNKLLPDEPGGGIRAERS